MMIGRFLVAAVATLSVFVSSARSATTIWLEAELFGELGGWTNDAQFVSQMGSPFLLAIGLEKPVADAITRVQVPQAGKYRLWVRTRDWTPEHSPGRFQVVLGGKTVEHVFGQSKKKDWVWENGGDHHLAVGPLEVRLKDRTGHYARCDVVVLTDDLDFVPPDDLPALAKLREQFGGVSARAERMPQYDTVVVGGGLAGTMAAIASARSGCKTALIQNRPVLGGNGSSEILVNPEGDTTREPLDPGETGIIEEFRGNVFGYSDRMLAVVKRQPNLDLFLNTHATGVEMKDAKTIAAVYTIETTTGRRRVFPGSIFIDCTGDGVIGVWAGNEYRHGREPRSMYDESRAPEVGDGRTMGGTLRYMTEETADAVVFQGPAWARKFIKPEDIKPGRYPQLRFGGWQWVIEYGGMLNTYDDAEEIRDELLRIIWGLWDYTKNYSPKLRDQAKNFRLSWVSHVVGKRESRRLIGDYVMTEHDIDPNRLFDDRVSYGGWGVDLHPPGGFYDDEPPATFSHKVKFSVPFRSLYAKDIDNLMMAGRNISVSHAALGATRVMITCGLQGEAVGTAAGVCRKHQASPRVVAQRHIEELQQQLLKNGCYLIDLPNKDPRDLARGAKVRASSEAPASSYTLATADTAHALTTDRAVMFRTDARKLEKIALHLVSSSDRAVAVRATLHAARRLRDFNQSPPLAETTAQVEPGTDGWVEFDLSAELKPGFYFVRVAKAEKVSWSLFATQPEETGRAYMAGNEWKNMPGTYAIRLLPGADWARLASDPQAGRGEPFAAANAVNGFARAVRGWPNSWRPDPQQNLPQWIELDFGRRCQFDTVHVSFQSKTMRARDFAIEVAAEQGWKTVAEVKDNDDRRRVLTFPRVSSDKLRLTVQKASPEAGVCEIRVYDEGTAQGGRAANETGAAPAG